MQNFELIPNMRIKIGKSSVLSVKNDICQKRVKTTFRSFSAILDCTEPPKQFTNTDLNSPRRHLFESLSKSELSPSLDGKKT